MPSHRDTALNGRSARRVRNARNAPMLFALPSSAIASAVQLISDI